MTLLGIADPASFQRQIERLGAVVTGRCWMPDHHRFTDADLAQARSAARAAGAEWIITSEKDWARLRGLAGASEGDPPILRVAMTIAFRGDDEAALERQILERIQPAEAPASQGQPAGAAG
jgi:tetraacyldisaccharide 4'-kinase